MTQKPVEITGLWLHTWDEGETNKSNRIEIELEINGKWIKILSEVIDDMETIISHIVEPLGIRRCVESNRPQY